MLIILVTNWIDPVTNLISFFLGASVELPEGKTFDDLHPIPDFMKVTRLGGRYTAKGFKTVEFYEVEDGKLDEALKVQNNRESESQKLWKGYKSHIEILRMPNPPTD